MSVAFADYDHDGRLDMFVTERHRAQLPVPQQGRRHVRQKRRSSPASRCPTPDARSRAWAPTFRTTTTTAGRTSTSRRLPARRFRSSRTTATGRSSRRRKRAGSRPPTVKTSGWCTVFADVDNDGWKDIFTANSHVNDRIGDFQSIQWKQPNSLFINGGQGDSDNAAASATRRRKPVSRATSRSTGDAASPTSTATAVSTSWSWSSAGKRSCGRTTATSDHHWLIVRLTGTKSNRDGIGARVSVGSQVRTMTTSIGYASSSHAGLHFGLGTAAEPVTVEVQWPSGIKQTVESVKTNQVVEIKEK